MKRIFIVALFLFQFGYFFETFALGEKCRLCCQMQRVIRNDYRNFYSQKNLNRLILGFGLTAFMANTQLDCEIQDGYQSFIRGQTSNRLAGVFKPAGNGRIMVPVYCGTLLIGYLASKTAWGNLISIWGGRSLRMVMVGAPLVLFLQRATGGSRPYENDSSWRFFNDDNGVSGHSFMGSVPFLTAVKMVKPTWMKAVLYAGSTLTGLSRINDNQHYLSQVFFGYLIGILASDSVSLTEKKFMRFTLNTHENSIGFDFSIDF